MVLLSLLTQGPLEEPLLVTKTASKFIILPQIFTAVVQELLLIVITLPRESRENLKCIDSILILKAEFKWLQVDYQLKPLDMEEISE